MASAETTPLAGEEVAAPPSGGLLTGAVSSEADRASEALIDYATRTPPFGSSLVDDDDEPDWLERILEDRVGRDPGRARAAATVKVPRLPQATPAVEGEDADRLAANLADVAISGDERASRAGLARARRSEMMRRKGPPEELPDDFLDRIDDFCDTAG